MELTKEAIENAVKETQQKSYVMIEFVAPGLAEFKIYKNNVTPAQVLGAISVLELQVKNWYIQEENKRMEMEREQQLSVPKPEILKPKG